MRRYKPPVLLESDGDDQQKQHEKADDNNGCRDRDGRLASRQSILHCSGLSRNEAHFGIIKRCDYCLRASEVQTSAFRNLAHLLDFEHAAYGLPVVRLLADVVGNHLIEGRLVRHVLLSTEW
jgi:hypothetical protein